MTDLKISSRVFTAWRSRETLVLAAELTAGVTAIAFAASAGLNLFLFSHWGLNYLQIASPADVVMGGIEVFLRLIPFLALAAGTSWLGRMLPMRGIGQALLGAFCLVAILGSFLLVARDLPNEGSSFGWFRPWRDYVVFVAVAAFGGLAAPLAERDGVAVSFNLLLGFTCFFVALVGVEIGVSRGYWPNEAVPRWAAGVTVEPCDEPQLLWSGSNAVVLECPGYRVVVRDAGALSIRVPYRPRWERSYPRP
ncbi:MAG TPA: hypothetical protein VF686_04865 [Brevundimonas sp.]